MRPVLLLLAAAALSAEAPAPADLALFNQALATLHVSEARAIVDRLMRERAPANGIPRPDPLLNAMLGRLYLADQEPAEAAIYLHHAPLSELPAPMRAPTALDRGRALDLTGDRAGALAAYKEAAAASEDAGHLRLAQLAIARDLLPDNPAAARDQVLPIAGGAAAPDRWEARYLVALASSVIGDAASARHWADEAWTDAPAAPLDNLATLRVETLRAGLAAAAHDTSSERAMLIASNGLKVTASGSMSEQLPVCGDDGIVPSDFVIFGFVAGPFLTRQLVPVAASRAAAVPPFYDALAGTSPIMQGGADAPLGTVFTVRCRRLVSPYYVATQPSADPLGEWAAAHGLYYASAFNESDDEHLKRVQDWVDTLTKRFGSTSPLLVLPQWQLLTVLQAQSEQGTSVSPGQLAALRSEVAAGMRRTGAPEWLSASITMPNTILAALRSAGNSSSATDALEGEYRKLLLEAPFTQSRQYLDGTLSNLHDDWPTVMSRLVLDLNGHVPETLSGRERQAWQFTVANALRSLGRDTEARSTLIAAGLPKEACAANDSELKRLEQHFSYDDYPPELLAGGQQGAVFFEFGLSPVGAPTDARIIYSLPSGLFDAISSKGLDTLLYAPPTRAGAPASCVGVYQSIRWQLEGSSDSSQSGMWLQRDLPPR
jgi:tetratricopeptide (TPR) repeat protein